MQCVSHCSFQLHKYGPSTAYLQESSRRSRYVLRFTHTLPRYIKGLFASRRRKRTDILEYNEIYSPSQFHAFTNHDIMRRHIISHPKIHVDCCRMDTLLKQSRNRFLKPFSIDHRIYLNTHRTLFIRNEEDNIHDAPGVRKHSLTPRPH